MAGAMLSTSLIQFYVDGQDCVHSLLFDQTMVEVMKIMLTSFKSLFASIASLSVPDPAAGHHRPTPALETLGHSWASLGQSLAGSLLSSPGSWCTQGFVCASKSLFPWSCVSPGGSLVGLMVTSSKRAYAIPRSAVLRAPALQQATVDPYLCRRH